MNPRTIVLNFETDAVFHEWFASLEDFDHTDRVAVERAIVAMAAPDATLETIAGELVDARRISTWLNRVSLAYLCWALAYPHPLGLLLVWGLIAPFVVLAMVQWAPERFQIGASPTDLRGDLNLTLMASMLEVLLAAPYWPIDGHGLLLPTALAWIPTVVGCFVATRRTPVVLFNRFALPLFLLVWAAGAVMACNGVFDVAPTPLRSAQVMTKSRAAPLGGHLGLLLSSQEGRREQIDVEVSRAAWDAASVGGEVCVCVHPGALGIAWFEVDAAPCVRSPSGPHLTP